jgi:hypothetical protein
VSALITASFDAYNSASLRSRNELVLPQHSDAISRPVVLPILVEPGRRKMVGGQEDMIFDVALDLLKPLTHEEQHAEPMKSEAN